MTDHEVTDATSSFDHDRNRETLSVEEKAARLYRGEALAPMVRASTTPLRTLALSYGADFCYTEELMDRSLTGTTRVVNTELQTIDYVKDASKMAAKQQRKLLLDGGPALYLRIDPLVERNRLVCQIGSGEPELAVAAALHVHTDVNAIDINMGCPKKFSVSGGMGSALLKDPDRACRIVRAVVDHVSSSNSRNPIPVSAKIRLLQDTSSTLDFISALIARGGAQAIAIHGRQVGDLEVQAAQWNELERVVCLAKSKFPTIPILINGDFYTRDEFTHFREKTGASGVLLARPALYNTSIFRKPRRGSILGSSETASTLQQGDEYSYTSPLLLDRTTVIQDYLRRAIKYDAHHKNIKYVVCEMMNSRRAPHPRVPFLPQVFSLDQTIGTTCACTSLSDICQLWKVDVTAEREACRRQRLSCGTTGSHIDHSQLIDTTGTSTTGTYTEATGTGGPLADEHRYLDSYILQFAGDATSIPPQPDSSKRPRVEKS